MIWGAYLVQLKVRFSCFALFKGSNVQKQANKQFQRLKDGRQSEETLE